MDCGDCNRQERTPGAGGLQMLEWIQEVIVSLSIGNSQYRELAGSILSEDKSGFHGNEINFVLSNLGGQLSNDYL